MASGDNEKPDGLLNDLKTYVSLKTASVRLSMVENLSLLVGKGMAIVVFLLLLNLAVLMFAGALTVLLACWVGLCWAFVIMGGFFCLLGLLAWVMRRSLFASNMVGTFSSMFFPEKNDDEDDEG